MAPRRTDKEKKKIIADFVQTQNYSETARLNGVSDNTVRNIVSKDKDFSDKCERKKEENSVDVLAYMDAHKDLVCSFLGKGLEVLNDPDKIAAANLSQITTAMGTLIDKWAMIGGNAAGTAKDDALSASLRELAEKMERER